MPIYALGNLIPNIHPDAFIADSAIIIGNVTIGKNASIWYNAVLRGDCEAIHIGENTNIQDGSVLHMESDHPLVIGKNVTVGHSVILHGATIGDNALIGMGATVLSYATIGAHSLVAANSLVAERKTFPERSLIMGMPAKIMRELSEVEIENLQKSADRYAENARLFKQQLRRIG